MFTCVENVSSGKCRLMYSKQRTKSFAKAKQVKLRPIKSNNRIFSVGCYAETPSKVDVAIVGGGIIGLFAAQYLMRAGLEVALIEKNSSICKGATGAGQGYIWLAHRDPESVMWSLAKWSKELWEGMLEEDGIESLIRPGDDTPGLRAASEWRQRGSLLLARTAEETAALRARDIALNDLGGISASWLPREAVRHLEPGLVLPSVGSGLLVPSDAEINGREAAMHLHGMCLRQEGFHSLVGKAAVGLCVDQNKPGGQVTGLRFSDGSKLKTRVGVVVAAGAWTGAWVKQAMEKIGIDQESMRYEGTGDWWNNTIVPRWGTLLEIEPPQGKRLINHSLMETAYTKHYQSHHDTWHARLSADMMSQIQGMGEAVDDLTDLDDSDEITFTANVSASGSLLVGSSRKMGDTASLGLESAEENHESERGRVLVERILDHAAEFLPDLSPQHVKIKQVRVGPRPAVVDSRGEMGVPLLGVVDSNNLPGLWVAAGHEGSGLTLGPATGELLAREITQSGFSDLPLAIQKAKKAMQVPGAAKRKLSP